MENTMTHNRNDWDVLPKQYIDKKEMFPTQDFIYAISEKYSKLDIWRGDKYEKIGSTNNLQGRLYEHNNASVLIPFEYNWYFRIKDRNGMPLKTIETAIHYILSSRHISFGAGTEFFEKDADRPAYQLIRQYMDSRGIIYEFIYENDILPKRRSYNASSKTIPTHIYEDYTVRECNTQIFKLMEEKNRHTFILPAGTGKTTIYIKQILKGGRHLVLSPSKSLIKNIYYKLIRKGINVYLYNEQLPETYPSNYVIISTYHSSKNFKDVEFDAIHYDEAHRIVISKENKFSEFQYMVKNSRAKKTILLDCYT